MDTPGRVELEPLGPLEPLDLGDITAPVKGQVAPILERLFEALPELDEEEHELIEQALGEVVEVGARAALGEFAGVVEARFGIRVVFHVTGNEG